MFLYFLDKLTFLIFLQHAGKNWQRHPHKIIVNQTIRTALWYTLLEIWNTKFRLKVSKLISNLENYRDNR